MSTRSKVAIKKDFGLIIAVYNHFDSYIEELGKTLVEKYNSKKLAQCLYAQAEKYELQGNRSVPSCKYWTANYYVCRYTSCPAVLTENLFQDNKDDVEYMLTKEGKETLANIHVNGILAYLKK